MTIIIALIILLLLESIEGFSISRGQPLTALSDSYLEDDLVAIQLPDKAPRLCVVKPYGTVVPLCQKEDDVETDLFFDPRVSSLYQDVDDSQVVKCYGESFYGQRVVPSLGGGPGYGAEADDVWSISSDTLEEIRSDETELPVLDVGISHGEKARGGFY